MVAPKGEFVVPKVLAFGGRLPPGRVLLSFESVGTGPFVGRLSPPPGLLIVLPKAVKGVTPLGL